MTGLAIAPQVIFALLERAQLTAFWSLDGPTPTARAANTDLAPSQRAALLLALSLWDGSGRAELARLLQNAPGQVLSERLRYLLFASSSWSWAGPPSER